jgi:peptidyl-prolyl cis-trans isomerase C
MACPPQAVQKYDGEKERGSIASVIHTTQGTIMAKTAAALHILVKEEKLAHDLLEQIRNGGDFEKLAKKHSICPSGKKGGHLGEFKQGAMVPAFDKVVFSCPVLEPTGPLHTQFGYHIIKVLYRN